MTIDREIIFQLVSNKNWQKLIDVFKENDNWRLIESDSILKAFIDQFFIEELLNNSSMNADVAYKYYLQVFFMLHSQNKYSFQLSNNHYKKLIIRIVGLEKDLKQANDYALKFPDEPICKHAIKQYQESIPKVIHHSQERELYVTENKNIHKVDASISLFKSNQEYQFYKAIREVYPTFLVIHNVALNAVINFDLIKNKLTPEEKKYFFGALLDCVVIDTENSYKPIKFIELDSHDHDKEKQKQNDKLKDNILAVAGHKLLRVRRATAKEGEKDFIKLIREIIK